MTELAAFETILADCRFCPMCKPAAEVADLRKIEGYSTRSRAMMLWRVVAGQREWTPRSAELLYESTLDGISEAFCVSDRPVSAYALAARQDVWAAGLAPETVRRAVEGVSEHPIESDTRDRVLVAAECAEAGRADEARVLAETLDLGFLLAPAGATAYALGATGVAAEQARAAAEELSGATVLVADGPQTQWMLSKVWPAVGVDVQAEVLSLPAYALALLEDSRLGEGLGECYLCESRAASFLADGLARPVAIQPGYLGEPDDSGQGAVFDDLRALVTRLGGRELRHRWERSLARSCGADDGLWASYPDLATALATAYLGRAREAGARTIVTDSPLAAAVLGEAAADEILVRWIGQSVMAAR